MSPTRVNGVRVERQRPASADTSAAMRLLDACVDVTEIALWLGHEQLTTSDWIRGAVTGPWVRPRGFNVSNPARRQSRIHRSMVSFATTTVPQHGLGCSIFVSARIIGPRWRDVMLSSAASRIQNS